MGWFENIKTRLGFGPEWDDDEYEDDDYVEESPVTVTSRYERSSRGARSTDTSSSYGSDGRPSYSANSPYSSGAATGAVRRRSRTPDLDRAAQVSGVELRSVPEHQASIAPMTPQLKIYNARPRTFEEANEFADKVRGGTPVVLDLTVVAPDVRRRIIDFASGLTFGLRGEIAKIADGVFMITPRNVEMADAERARSSYGPTSL